MTSQRIATHHIMQMLIAIVVGFARFFASQRGHSQTRLPQKEAFDLLMEGKNDGAPLTITVKFENGMYAFRYDMKDGASACPRGGDLIVPVGILTDINVTSNDRIIRWTFPQVGFDVTAIPGRIENQRLQLKEPGRYQVKPPPDNQDKVSDVPMNIMTEADFKVWLSQNPACS